MAKLKVRLVATDRIVYRGEASLVVLQTLEGQVGIMPQHSPMMASLADAPVLIRTDDGDIHAAVHAGFVTVDHDNVILLAETAELDSEIVVEAAERIRNEIGTPADGDEASIAKLKRAEVRLSVAAKRQTGGHLT
jgi:F-type H+-transporting ATPase subunit epsilon